MRWFLTIFAFYITVLAVIPCNDVENQWENGTELATDTEHNHDHDSDDTCTPFCCCTCCGIQMNIVEYRLMPVEITAVQEFSSEKIKINAVSFHSNYFGEIWQPPQINA